jgi:hypothetical protein
LYDPNTCSGQAEASDVVPAFFYAVRDVDRAL